MSRPRSIPELVRATQARSADPVVSSFVSANAGAGKTHVLVQRVIRLLLNDTPPEKILCITFTKAAAANMADRVFRTLSDWISLDDAALDARLRDTGVIHPTAKLRRRARELFARALETPGGLKVQTIHALCTRLLQQFPFEANVPAHFSVLEDRDQADMIERASLAVLLDASANPESATGRALTFAMMCAADTTFRNIVHEACLGDGTFRAFLDGADSIESAIAAVSRALGVDGNDRPADIEREIVDGPNLPSATWAEIAGILETSGPQDNEQAARLRASLPLTGSSQVREYLWVFLKTTDSEPRVNLITKTLARLQPPLAAAFDREAQRLPLLIERWRAVTIRDRSAALIAIASAIIRRYRAEKQERGLLDYDDLIDKTLTMLKQTDVGWVHYKLDRGIDHVLIDEAQDTSPKQWQIVDRLVADFASGSGARGDLTRTLFAVGDEKQSIFSFQGAAPHEFDLRHKQFRRLFEQGQRLWDKDIRLNYSFRSGTAILSSVDKVFCEEAIYQSIHTAALGPPLHEALADAAPGMVELWALETPDERPEIEGWQAPFDAVSETSPEVKLARRMAETVRALTAGSEMTGRADERRALRPGDVLVLVRRRGKLFDAVIQQLKHAGVAVAGADRLKLTEHIAIIDLMNLTDAVLLPHDDLALAVALKSPLFGLDETELFNVSLGRRGRLRAALAAHAAADPHLAEVETRLKTCELRAAGARPFEFYSWLLGEDGGRARILKRLTHEANDAIDEFLELALKFEQRAVPSLQGFMAWLRSSDTEIKRDMEISRDEVRVMTVHGAKGLEAPVVFLMDTTASPTDAPRLNLIRVPTASGECVVWAGRKADDCAAVAAARAKMVGEIEDEYRRLLYVAMTRAAERLVIGGVMPANRSAPRVDWWYQLIEKGLRECGLSRQVVDTASGPVTRFMRPEDFARESGAATAALQVRPSVTLPGWLRATVTKDSQRQQFVRPSDAGEPAMPVRPVNASPEAHRRAQQRGTLVHRLLQSLPEIAADRRREVAQDFLTRNAKDWSPEQRNTLLERTLALIENRTFAVLFGAGSRAEVPIVGRIPRAGLPPLLVSGQIDRLVVSPTRVVIADFKTNQAPPLMLADTPRAYLRQLALYRAVIAALHPERAVQAMLVWTETPEIMMIPPEVLDETLGQIISP